MVCVRALTWQVTRGTLIEAQTTISLKHLMSRLTAKSLPEVHRLVCWKMGGWESGVEVVVKMVASVLGGNYHFRPLLFTVPYLAVVTDVMLFGIG